MNTNEIRFYLHNYDNLKNEIKHLQEALDQYRRMDISGIKAQVITDMPICHSNTSKTELMATTRMDYIKDLEGEIDSKLRLINAINSVYLYLEEPKKTIINLRYMEIPIGRPKFGWKEIADKANMTEESCRKIDSRVILRIQTRYLDTTKPKDVTKCHKQATYIDKQLIYNENVS